MFHGIKSPLARLPRERPCMILCFEISPSRQTWINLIINFCSNYNNVYTICYAAFVKMLLPELRIALPEGCLNLQKLVQEDRKDGVLEHRTSSGGHWECSCNVRPQTMKLFSGGKPRRLDGNRTACRGWCSRGRNLLWADIRIWRGSRSTRLDRAAYWASFRRHLRDDI